MRILEAVDCSKCAHLFSEALLFFACSRFSIFLLCSGFATEMSSLMMDYYGIYNGSSSWLILSFQLRLRFPLGSISSSFLCCGGLLVCCGFLVKLSELLASFLLLDFWISFVRVVEISLLSESYFGCYGYYLMECYRSWSV
ncbi:hypothetical protein V6N12_007749 [Hibiscus sabdariffa]|uniref:Uncharacterized protein n=1 Tax=Hibiscus sabdariffa TaxID=183260 RepID=A0ABR2F2P8_9ROSI